MALAQSFPAPYAMPKAQADAFTPKPSRFYLHGIPIDRLPMEQAVAWVIDALKRRESGRPLLIMGPNAQLVTLAAQKPRFAAALKSASLSVPDGISVVLAARLLGQPVPERVTGGDLMERLCIQAARHNLSVFFLGGLPGAAEKTARKFERHHPGFRTAGVSCPPVGFENDPAQCARIRRHIASARPDLLCVAFGAPKQELWMAENCPTLPIGAAISVGAALDTQSGLRQRAPQWTHRVGLEWLYRLVREPRRLGHRYLVGNTQFIALVAKQWWQESTRDRSKNAHPAALFTK
ncbi:MAG TPA: WecB/TagA/CpsF family glycosyltransferase [Acidobacteriaceae bacterium]|nr:WecB/TagA/CpsF family glycosyltransferase [Acidobacteriaceae bacterium]